MSTEVTNQWLAALREFVAAGDREGWATCRKAWSMPLIMRGARIENLDLSGFDLGRGNFSETVFERCNLTAADLSSCNVDHAVFRGCDLSGCFIGATNFRWATLDPPDSLATAVDTVPPPAPRPSGGGVAASACQSKAVGLVFGRGG